MEEIEMLLSCFTLPPLPLLLLVSLLPLSRRALFVEESENHATGRVHSLLLVTEETSYGTSNQPSLGAGWPPSSQKHPVVGLLLPPVPAQGFSAPP